MEHGGIVGRSLGVGALLVTIGLLVPAGAGAATVTVNAGTLRVVAGAGESNVTSAESAGAFIRVFDHTANLNTSDPDCTQVHDHFVRCGAAGVTTINLRGRDQNDTLTLNTSISGDLEGGSGVDTLRGGSGSDTLAAGSTNPFGFGTESLEGGNGGDVLRGPTGNQGSSLMIGGDGADTLIGGSGQDSLRGDAGADVLRGGDGPSDAADYTSSGVGVIVSLDNAANDGAPGEGDNARADIENIQGSFNADVLTGSGVNNQIEGFSGNDLVRGGAGDDNLGGGADNDTLIAGAGEDSMQGGSGNVGADDFRGGTGIDRASFTDHFDPATPLNITINGSADDGAPGEGDNVRADVENIDGGPGPDTITGNAQANQLEGGGGSDNLVGGGGDDRLFGVNSFGSSAPGNDSLAGGVGDDVVAGGTNGDDLRGNGGFDTVLYPNTSDPLTITINNSPNDGRAGEGDNVRTDIEGVIGGNAADSIIGSSGDNVFMGGGGGDTLNGAAGDDLLDGETPGSFSVLGADTLVGGPGNDSVSYASHFSPVTADNDNVADDGQAGENDDIRASVENIFGGASSDTLTGDSGANVLDGGEGFGADILSGAGGGDFLSGGFGSDTLNGEAGNDRLHSRGDGTLDTDNCGANTDTVEADSFDTLNDCENVFNPASLTAGRSAANLERRWERINDSLALAEDLAKEVADRARK